MESQSVAMKHFTEFQKKSTDDGTFFASRMLLADSRANVRRCAVQFLIVPPAHAALGDGGGALFDHPMNSTRTS